MPSRRRTTKTGRARDTSSLVFRWDRLTANEAVAKGRALWSAVAARPASDRPQERAVVVEESQPPSVTPSASTDGLIPAKSIDRADSVFRAFSVSKLAGDAESASYVSPADGTTAQSVQRDVIEQQLGRLSATDSANLGMTLALPRSEVEKLLPSINDRTSTLELSDVLKIVRQHLRGTEFYANGNPTLNRLTVQARAREIVADIAKPSDRPAQAQEDKSARALLRRWYQHPKSDADKQEPR